MSAALAALSFDGPFSAFSADDGDTEHIHPDAFDDGLPIFAGGFDDELEEDTTPPPVVRWCCRWDEAEAAQRGSSYRVQPVGPAGVKADEPMVDLLPRAAYAAAAAARAPGEGAQPSGASGGEWPCAMRLRGCQGRPAPEDAVLLPAARLDTFFIAPVLTAEECAEVRAEVDEVVGRVGWVDDGTGAKLQVWHAPDRAPAH